MNTGQPFELLAADGFVLTAYLFSPPARLQPRQSVLISSALAVPQRFYARFATWLANQGFVVLTFDPRGMGASRPAAFAGSLRGFATDFGVWAEQDFSAAVLWLKTQFPNLPLQVIGHSLGAQQPGMASQEAQRAIDGLLAIGSGSGYWRDWAWRSQLIAPLLLHSLGPLLNRLLGYFPGRRLGLVGDLPHGVMRQWIHWCRHPDFAWGADPQKILAGYQQARFPIHAIGLSDDESMTQACTRKLLAAYTNAPSRLEMLDPAQLGLGRVGHMGFFRRQFSDSLWPRVLAILEQKTDARLLV
ncbi:alpha/beta hydrolase family protein [Pseudomonas sp. Marseille-Q8238]